MRDRFRLDYPDEFVLMVLVSSTKIAAEAQHGLIAQVLKDIIFSIHPNAQSKTEELSQVTDMAIG